MSRMSSTCLLSPLNSKKSFSNNSLYCGIVSSGLVSISSLMRPGRYLRPSSPPIWSGRPSEKKKHFSPGLKKIS